METGHVSKRQKHDQKAEIRPKPHMGLQHSENISLEDGLQMSSKQKRVLVE